MFVKNKKAKCGQPHFITKFFLAKQKKNRQTAKYKKQNKVGHLDFRVDRAEPRKIPCATFIIFGHVSRVSYHSLLSINDFIVSFVWDYSGEWNWNQCHFSKINKME